MAAYARVSTALESQESSLDNQISHYSSLISSEANWTLAGIYCEKDVSATNAQRPELKRLLSDCRAGQVDLILTKSISRFSRNTADCLRLVRELTAIGVNLWFEKENIRTDCMESEFLLSILSAFAQDESRSISKNVRWGIQARFRNGTYVNTKAPYGYIHSATSPADPVSGVEHAVENSLSSAGPTVESMSDPAGAEKNGTSAYSVNPAEAEIVRRIFSYVLDGMGTTSIARRLNKDNVPTWTVSRSAGASSSDEEEASANDGTDEVEEERGEPRKWYSTTVLNIIRNPFYVGDCLFQKTYMDENYVQRVNTGQFDQYLDEGNHPAIIDREVWEEANQIIGHCRVGSSIFSGKVFCSRCGRPLYRKLASPHPRLNHAVHQFPAGEAHCGTRILQPTLENVVTTMLNKVYIALSAGLPIMDGELAASVLARGLQEDFDEDFFSRYVRRVDIGEGSVTVAFTDGIVLTESIPAGLTVTSAVLKEA